MGQPWDKAAVSALCHFLQRSLGFWGEGSGDIEETEQ